MEGKEVMLSKVQKQNWVKKRGTNTVTLQETQIHMRLMVIRKVKLISMHMFPNWHRAKICSGY